MSLKEKALVQLGKIKLNLLQNDFNVSSISEKDFNFEFDVLVSSKKKIKVLIYFGKKGIKVLIQGDETAAEFKKVKELVYDNFEFDFTEKELNEPAEYIGSDECGKGDFFGPLVIASAYVNKTSQNKLKQIGVRDSKDLNDSQIHKLAKEIRHIIPDDYEIIRINPAKYNQLYNELKNLNKLLNWAHSRAIENLLQRKKCNIVITDKFASKELNVSLNGDYSSVEFVQIPRAEKFVGVAAASILARDVFNEWFDAQSKNGIVLPKGSSDAVDNKSSEIFKKIGEDKFSEFAKLHFKTMKKIKK